MGNSYLSFVIHILHSSHGWCIEFWRRVVVEEEMVETIVGLVCCHEMLDLIF